MPDPDNDTLRGVLVALVAMLRVANLLAAPSGLNITRIVQEAPAFKVSPQLLVCANQDA
jgi:hypothetical protein